MRFVNNWVKNLLPPRPEPLEGSTIMFQPEPSPPNNDPTISNRDDSASEVPDQAIMETFLASVHCNNSQIPGGAQGSADLLSILRLDLGNRREGSGTVIETTKFTYAAQQKEYYFTLKECDVQYREERCTAVVISDLTILRQLSTLEEKYRKILLASVVHDIRAPIQGIIGVLDALDTPQRTAEEKEYIQIGHSTCDQLNFLTYDITDLGQLEAGKFKVVPTSFSPFLAVQDCVNSLSFSFKAKGINMALNADDFGAGRKVLSDKHRYMQIVMNLLSNALKFTSRRGTVSVTISADRSQGLLITEVRDTGVGIREEEIPNLFKLFGKLQSSAALNPNGVGLGLTICKKLSVALGGNITVSSKPGIGASFVFTIKENAVSSEQECEGDCSCDQGSSVHLDTNPRLLDVHSSRFAQVTISSLLCAAM